MKSKIVLLCAAASLGGCPKGEEVPPSPPLRGMYSYFADSGWFVDCRSGVRMPVSHQGDNAALERAYTGARAMAGAPMLATVHGRVEEVPPMEGPQPVATLIVEQFISVEAQGCSGPSSTAELENTYWKLMTLNGTPAESPAGAREIHFVLHREGARLAGFSGCNGLTGTYRVDGDKITFTDMAGTLMACANTMDLERRIHEMFPRVTGWTIAGETLQLTDSNGAQIATFESRYLK